MIIELQMMVKCEKEKSVRYKELLEEEERKGKEER